MELVVALLVAGVMLLLLETILPGGVAGAIGLICLISGVVIGYNRFGVQSGNLILFCVTVVLIVGAILWVKIFPNSPFARPFISNRTIGTVRAEKPELLEQTGLAYTNLRPSGTAIINGTRVDVVTEGGMVERGTKIKVVQIEGLRVVVRPLNFSEIKTNDQSQTKV